MLPIQILSADLHRIYCYLEQALYASKQGSLVLTQLALSLSLKSAQKVIKTGNQEFVSQLEDKISTLLNEVASHPICNFSYIKNSCENIKYSYSLCAKIQNILGLFPDNISFEHEQFEVVVNNSGKIKIAVVCAVYFPTLEHREFAETSIASIRSSQLSIDKIAVVNYAQTNRADDIWLEQNFDHIIVNDLNNLSRAWNKGISKAFLRGADYVLVINHDLALQPGGLDYLIAFALENPKPLLWSASPVDSLEEFIKIKPKAVYHQDVHMSCFLVDRRLFQYVGKFDEKFEPAYFEDADMLRRIHLAGHLTGRTELCWFYHVNRGSINMCLQDLDSLHTEHLGFLLSECGNYYVRKWGGVIGHEKFIFPFNNQSIQ